MYRLLKAGSKTMCRIIQRNLNLQKWLGNKKGAGPSSSLEEVMGAFPDMRWGSTLIPPWLLPLNLDKAAQRTFILFSNLRVFLDIHWRWRYKEVPSLLTHYLFRPCDVNVYLCCLTQVCGNLNDLYLHKKREKQKSIKIWFTDNSRYRLQYLMSANRYYYWMISFFHWRLSLARSIKLIRRLDRWLVSSSAWAAGRLKLLLERL